MPWRWDGGVPGGIWVYVTPGEALRWVLQDRVGGTKDKDYLLLEDEEGFHARLMVLMTSTSRKQGPAVNSCIRAACMRTSCG